MLMVSDETHDRTTADSVMPSAENRHTTVRFEMVARGVIGRVWARVVDMVRSCGVLDRSDRPRP